MNTHRTTLIGLLAMAWTLVAAQSTRTQLSDLPTLYIETENGQDITDKENYITCTATLVDGGEETVYENTLIRGRGNSSWWNSPKKPYRIKFDKKQRIMGPDGANAKSWPLLANHGDKTLMRNALTRDLGRFVGLPFCPDARFVDLVLNGRYRGNYQFSDQVQVHKRRVEINEQTGWLLEQTNNNAAENPCIRTIRGYLYNIKNPDDDVITQADKTAISTFLNRMEELIFGDDYQDPVTGYRSMIDAESLVNWYVAAEITGNIDALYSIYMYKDGPDDKLHFGPLWDLDLGYDNSSERSLLRNMEAFLYLSNRPFEKILRRLWTHPWFAHACAVRLHELVDAGLEDYLLERIDFWRNHLFESQQRNFTVWPINAEVYSWEKHTYHNDYDEYVDDLRNFVRVHLAYLVARFDQLDPGEQPDLRRGDVNGDGVINATDIALVVNVIAGIMKADDVPGKPDVNGDGKVNSADISVVIDLINGQ